MEKEEKMHYIDEFKRIYDAAKSRSNYYNTDLYLYQTDRDFIVSTDPAFIKMLANYGLCSFELSPLKLNDVNEVETALNDNFSVMMLMSQRLRLLDKGAHICLFCSKDRKSVLRALQPIIRWHYRTYGIEEKERYIYNLSVPALDIAACVDGKKLMFEGSEILKLHTQNNIRHIREKFQNALASESENE